MALTATDEINIAAPGGDKTALTSAITKLVDFSGVPALAQFQRLLSKLANATEDAAAVLAGDSTGDATSEWFYLLGAALAVDYPAWTFKHAAWNDGTSAYDSPTTIAAGSGALICTFYNGSIAGSVASRHAGANFAAAVVAPSPDLVFLSYGHNGSTTGPRQLDFFDGIAVRLRTEMPEVPIIQIGQNPTLSDETMAAKIAVLSPFAARNGWGFISIHDAFKQAGVSLSTLLADEVHPNATGSALWRDTVLASMRASRAAYGGGSIVPSSLLASWAYPAEFDEWAKSNVTFTQDTTNFETLGRSASLTCAAPGVAYISKVILSGDDIKAVRGKWITFWVVQRVPAGNDETSGRLDLVDSGGTTSAVGAQQGPDFVLFSVRKKIDVNATTLTAYIYPSSTAGVTNTIQVDRAGLALGLSPVDFLPSAAFFSRSVRIMGSNANGIGVHYNANTTAEGHRFVDASGNVLSNWAADGFFTRGSTNTHYRYALTSTAGFQMGPGTGVFDMGIDRQLGGIARLSGADWYSDTNGTRYLGSSSQQWRAAFVKDGVYVQNKLKLAATSIPTLTAATDPASTQTLVNAIRSLLIAEGLAT